MSTPSDTSRDPSSPAPAAGTNAFAVVGLVCSVLWLFGLGSVAGIIFSAVGLQTANRGGGGRRLAIAGLLLGVLGLVYAVALVFGKDPFD